MHVLFRANRITGFCAKVEPMRFAFRPSIYSFSGLFEAHDFLRRSKKNVIIFYIFHSISIDIISL